MEGPEGICLEDTGEVSLLFLTLSTSSASLVAAWIAFATARSCQQRSRRQRAGGSNVYRLARRSTFFWDHTPRALGLPATTPPRQRSVSFRLLSDNVPDTSSVKSAWGDELFSDPGLRPIAFQLRQQAMAWVERRKRGIRKKISGARGTLQLIPGGGDGLESLFALPATKSTAADFDGPRDSPLPSSSSLSGGLSASASSSSVEGFGLSDDGRLAFDALTRLDVFGATQVPTLLKLCRRVTTAERRAGELLLEEGGSMNDVLVLRSGSCEAFVGNGYNSATDADAAAAAAADQSAGSGGGGAAAGSAQKNIVSPLAPAAPMAMAAATTTRSLMTMAASGTLLMGLLDILALMVEDRPVAHVGIRCLTDCTVVHIPRLGDLFRLVSVGQTATAMAPPPCDAALSTVLRALMARTNRATLITGFLHLGLIHDLRTIAGEGGGASESSNGSGRSGSGGGDSGGDSGAGGGGSTPASSAAAEAAARSRSAQHWSMSAIRRLVGDALGLHDCGNLPRIDLPFPTSPTPNRTTAGERFSSRRRSSGTSSSGALRTRDASLSPDPQPQPLSLLPPLPPAAASAALDGLRLQLVALRAGQAVFAPEDPPCVYVVVRGFLRATVSLERLGLFGGDGTAPSEHARHGPGSVVGQLSLLTGSTSDWYRRSGGNATPMLTVTAADVERDGADDCTTAVVRITRAAHDAILRSNPEVAAAVARRLVASTPPLLRVFDFGLGYVSIPPGSVVVRQGEHYGNCLYVVLHGRLHAAVDVSAAGSSGGAGARAGSGSSDGASAGSRAPGTLEVLAEYGRGTLIGESEAITREASWATVQAVRHSSLARIHASMLSFLASRHPSIIAYLAKHASDKRYKTVELLTNGPDADASAGGRPKTVMVCPISGSVPLDLFTATLKTALQNTGSSTKVLTSGLVASKLGLADVDSFGSFEMAAAATASVYSILAPDAPNENDDSAEDDYGNEDIGDGGDPGGDSGGGGGGSNRGRSGGSGPTATRLSLAVGGWLAHQEERYDVVLYVCDWYASNWNRLCGAQADRVLLVGNANDAPELSSLEKELDVTHSCPSAQVSLVLLHVDPPAGYAPKGTKGWITRRNGITGHFHLRLHSRDLAYDCHNHKSDFRRLARCLTGRAVGLVLGGGGARGMAHVGILRAVEEEGIPVDLICGTSQGALVGGAYALADSYLEILPRCHSFARRMGSVWNYLKDITLPTTAYFTGIGFNYEVGKVLGKETKIEDLWLPYFCVSTDLTTSRGRAHRNGTMWRYVRASMSLAGYLPPMCEQDPHTGRVHFLMDGGYCNNLPADLMKQGLGAGLGAGLVIACDVGAEWMFVGDSYGENLSGWKVLLRKLQPWGEKLKIPSMAEINAQLAYISSVKQLEEARARYVDLYLRPPVSHFATLDFHKYAEIEAAGYEYARPLLRAFKRQVGSCAGTLLLPYEAPDLRRARSADMGGACGGAE